MDLRTIKPGDEIYFLDKSEGPGAIFYVQGTVISIGQADAALEVLDSGTLIAPGYLAPYDPARIKGSIIKVAPDTDFEFLSLDEFSRLREQYEVVPQGTPFDEGEPREVNEEEGKEEKEEEEEKPASREEIEEGAPDLEIEEDGLYLVANLQSWGDTQGIFWPKGFPQDWMEQVYKDLPEGAAWESGGEPVVAVPGSKGPGIPPDSKADLEKEYNEASQVAQDAAKQMDKAKALLEAAEEAGDKDAIAAKYNEITAAIEAFEKAKREFLAVAKRISGTEGGWIRPPDEATYTRIPGRHMPRDVSFGKAGLRQELKQLSNNFKKTLDLIKDVNQTEYLTDQYQKELDLILRLRKKQLVEKFKGKYVLEEGPRRSFSEALNLLKKLKEKELKKKPYLFSTERSTEPSPYDPKGTVTPSERDRIVEDATSTAMIEDRVGGPVSFFDLPPEEVDMLIKKEVEKSGPMDPKDVAARAKEYAEEYKEFLKKQAEWKDISEEIRKYLRVNHSLAISQEQSDRLEKEIYAKGARQVTVRGRDTGPAHELREISIPVQTIFDEVVKPIAKGYEKRVQYLQFLQNNRKNALARQKAELRRKLVEEEEGKSVPIDDSKYKDAIISLFGKYAKYSHEQGTSEKIPSRFRIHHGLPATEEKNKELAELVTEETNLQAQLKKLTEDLHKIYVSFEKASEDLELFQEDMRYLRDNDTRVAKSGILESAEAIGQIVNQIKKLLRQREFVRKFPDQGSASQIREVSENIHSPISALESYKISLSMSIPQKYISRLSDILNTLRKAVGAYESVAGPAEEKMSQINLRLEEIRDKKGTIAEEIT